MMETRAARAVTKAVVAAGTVGTMASVYWLLNRFVDGNDCGRLNDAFPLPKVAPHDDGYDENHSEKQYDFHHSEKQYDFHHRCAKLPVISEADEGVTEDATGYTGDYYTPSYDICMLSVSIKTLVASFSDQFSRDCGLCKATQDCASTIGVDRKVHTLSFLEPECSSNESMRSAAGDSKSMTEQWLYVRL